MFQLYADKNKLALCQREPVTSGSVNVYRVRFEFSEDWAGLTKTVFFRSGRQTVPLLLPEDGECVIPWEVTDPDDAGKTLYAGVCGTLGGRVVLPTVEASLGVILEGVAGWPASPPPTPGVYEQILAVLEKKQDKLKGLPGQIVGFDESGEAAARDLPSGEGGSTDHRQLLHRDAEKQHPIEAITGLAEALQRIPEPITIKELEEILK